MARITYGSVVVCDALVELQDVHVEEGTIGRVRGSNTPYKYDGSNWATEQQGGSSTLPFINAKASPYNAVGDGMANDTAAMQAAIDAVKDTGDTLFIPVGTYLVDELLVNGSSGVSGTAPTIIGAGNQKSILKARTTGQLSVLRVSQQYTSVSSLRFEAADKAQAGLLLHNAGFGSVYSCSAFNAVESSFQFWNVVPSVPVGNNDGMTVMNCAAGSSVVGFEVKIPAGGGLTDNNVITFVGCNALSNSSHGMLLKGHGNIVIGGVFEGNGGYGVRLGESADAPTSWTGNVLLYPYFEANTLGDIMFTQAVRNLYHANVAGSTTVDPASAAQNVKLSFNNRSYEIQPAFDGPAMQVGSSGLGLSIIPTTATLPVALYTGGTGQLRLGQTLTGADGGPVVVGDDAGKVGFFGATPIVRPAAYTPTNVVTTRTYDANATTIDALSDVLGTLITDLKALGLLQ